MEKITKEKALELTKRMLVYLVGMVLIAFGVNIAINSNLGVSPVNSIPLVLNKQFPFFTMGTWATLVFCMFVLVQLVLLLKEFKWYYLFQFLVSTVFGWFIDGTAGLAKVCFPALDNYFVRLVYIGVSLVMIALGVMLYLEGNIMSMPAEGVALALSKRTKWAVSTCKMIFDTSVTLIAIILSFLFFGELNGVREGTIIVALGVGFVMKPISKWLKKPLNNWMYKQTEKK